MANGPVPLSSNTSDGYHTFDELYEHRHMLLLALTKCLYNISQFSDHPNPWMSRKHDDGSMIDGWFIVGLENSGAESISYHVPMKYWDDFEHWCIVLDAAPPYNGYTPSDVLARLRRF